MEFGEFIKGVRKRKSISARELARRAGISQAYLSQLETGKHHNPSREVVEKISKVLEVDYWDMTAKITDVQVIDEERMTKILDNYAAITEYKGDDIDGKIQFRLEKLFSDEITLTYNHKPLTNDEKRKIFSIIETILK